MSTACPRCGVVDLDAPCLGDPHFGSRPLKYRHAGRQPPLQSQPRLDGPNLTESGLWDTETRRSIAGNGGRP